MLRYVVLHHTGIENPHYDLMLEVSPRAELSTWRVSHWPPLPDDAFTPLPNHRRAYLEYEGPISGERGQVTRVAAGTVEIIRSVTCQLTVSLAGAELTLPTKTTV